GTTDLHPAGVGGDRQEQAAARIDERHRILKRGRLRGLTAESAIPDTKEKEIQACLLHFHQHFPPWPATPPRWMWWVTTWPTSIPSASKEVKSASPICSRERWEPADKPRSAWELAVPSPADSSTRARCKRVPAGSMRRFK